MTEDALRLCILTQYFPPERGAAQARLSELGERLIDRGWAVEALTALPNYPTGRVFEGYPRRHVVVETVGRIRTVRVPLLPSQTGFARRLACYGSFAASAALQGPRHWRRPDLVWVESPPPFVGLAALAFRRRFGCDYVFNVSDLWPESAIQMGVITDGGLPARLGERLVRSCYIHAAGITGQTTETVATIAREYPDTPAAVITNGVEPDRFGPDNADAQARTLVGDGPGPLFLYAGLLGLAQGLDQVLDLARQLPPDVPGRMVLVGEGPLRSHLQDRIAAEGIDRVRLVPPQPRDRVPALLACADAAIVTLGYRLPGAVPSKVYEAMAARLPILLVAEGEPAERVLRAGAGIAVPPGDMAGMRDAFTRIATDGELRRSLGAAGRRAAETEYRRDSIADELDQFLRSVLARAAQRSRETSSDGYPGGDRGLRG